MEFLRVTGMERVSRQRKRGRTRAGQREDYCRSIACSEKRFRSIDTLAFIILALVLRLEALTLAPEGEKMGL
jgi:hypothetical protein